MTFAEGAQPKLIETVDVTGILQADHFEKVDGWLSNH